MRAAVLLLAWRNVLRHRWRSAITVVATAIGVAALLFLWGLNDGAHNTMIRNFQATFAGSVQIHQSDSSREPRFDTHLSDPEAITAALAAAGVTRWTPRLQSFALAAGTETSAGVLLVGIDPAREVSTTRIAASITRGRFVMAEDKNACILGATTARNLELEVGRPVVLLAQGRDGALAAERFTIVGIVSSGVAEIDRGMVLAPLRSVQELLGTPGGMTDVVAMIPERRLTEVTDRLRGLLKDRGLEVLRWDEMAPLLRETVAIGNGFYYVFLGVVLVIVVTGVLNTVLVSMLERGREFGVLMALGTRSAEIGAMVAAEALMLGALGAAVGTLAGLGLVAFFGRIGIDLAFLGELRSDAYLDAVLYTEINTDHLIATLMTVVGANWAAALYPAWKATRLEPVDAIRNV